MKMPTDIELLEEKISRLEKKEHIVVSDSEPSFYSTALKTVFLLTTELIAAIVVGSGIGYGLDCFFSTSPLFMIIFLLLGSIAGFLNIYRIVKYQEDQNFEKDKE